MRRRFPSPDAPTTIPSDHLFPLTTTDMPAHIILSAFADEAAYSKTAVEQFSALAALGLKYYSPRFVDVTGAGTVKHVVALDDAELAKLAQLQKDYGLSVTSIGSRIGKVKIVDVADKSHNKYVDPAEYMKTEVAATLKAAKALGAKMVRGFSFYQPHGEDPWKYVDQAVERLKPIVDACGEAGLIYGLEVEANLIGQNGRLLATLAEKTGRKNLVCIFDGGNLSSQNLTWMEVFDEYVAMRGPHRLDPHQGLQGRPQPEVDGRRRRRAAQELRAREHRRLGPRSDPPRLQARAPEADRADEVARSPRRVPGAGAASQGGRTVRRIQRAGWDGRRRAGPLHDPRLRRHRLRPADDGRHQSGAGVLVASAGGDVGR